jgi:Glucose-6-phosphate dehydrogenase, C-terminal domain
MRKSGRGEWLRRESFFIRTHRAGAQAKKPGEAMIGEAVDLVVRHQPGDEMQPYERLLGDAVRGDAALFARQDGIEATWQVVEPALGNPGPLYEYEPGSWGPPQAYRLVAPGGSWHNPAPPAPSGSAKREARSGIAASRVATAGASRFALRASCGEEERRA